MDGVSVALSHAMGQATSVTDSRDLLVQDLSCISDDKPRYNNNFSTSNMPSQRDIPLLCLVRWVLVFFMLTHDHLLTRYEST